MRKLAQEVPVYVLRLIYIIHVFSCSSMSIYMDVLNIFIRIATIMSGNRRK